MVPLGRTVRIGHRTNKADRTYDDGTYRTDGTYGYRSYGSHVSYSKMSYLSHWSYHFQRKANRMITPHLQPESTTPLQKQLYEQLREAILTGQLRSGTRLPSTRGLAEELGISRNTVLNAFSQLLAEGYLEGVHGSGTFVAHALPDRLLQAARKVGGETRTRRRARGISQRGKLLARTNIMVPREVPSDDTSMISFRPGVPDVDVFLSNAWHQAARRWDRLPKTMLGYGDFAGYPPLREQIAKYLTDARGVRCGPDQVLIVNGSQQALDLSARVLLDPGDSAFVEDPGYLGVKGALLGAGVKLIPLPIDEQGIVISRASSHPDGKLTYTTPSFQFPLGITMPLSRRLELLEWARSSSAWILEDDYDSQYRYAGAPLPALHGLDRHERVIYIGTFSKVMFPALRLGYMVVPKDLVKPFAQARALTDHHSPTIQQGVMAKFMEEGHFARHVRRMRALYKKRQAHLLTCCEKELKGVLEVHPAEAGMHVMAWLPQGWKDKAVSTHLAQNGIEALALAHFTLKPYERSGLLLGYPALSEHLMEAGVKRMAEALRNFEPSNS